MKAKLIKTPIGIYRLMVENSDYDYGHTSPEYCELQNRDGSYSHKLSLKNCQAIERGYDLDELAKIEYPICEVWNDEEALIRELAFKNGFQKALEILGDKKFTEDNLLQAIEMYHGEGKTLIEIIKSLQQTEWDVEILMECGEVKQCECSSNKNCLNPQPKLDADGCLILIKK